MRRAFLLACVVSTTLSAAANPPDEDVLRPHIPSEGQLYIEPHVGLNFTFLSADSVRQLLPGESNLDFYRSGFGIAPLVGVTVGYQFSPTIGAELDVSYDGRKSVIAGTSIDACAIIDFNTGDTISRDSFRSNKEVTFAVDYLSLGFIGTFGFGSAFLMLGPTASIPVSRSIEESVSFDSAETSCRYFYRTADQTASLQGTANDVDAATHISLRIGAGYRLRIADRMELIPRISYNLGLTDTFTGDGGITYRKPGSVNGQSFTLQTDKSMQLNALQTSIGLRITL